MYKFHPYLGNVQVECEVLAYSPAEKGVYTNIPENCYPDEPVVFEYEYRPVNEEDSRDEVFHRPLTDDEELSLLKQFKEYINEQRQEHSYVW